MTHLTMAFLLLLGAATPAPDSACPKDVPALLAAFRGLVGFQVDFVEEKQVALLKKPLINKGRVLFAAPDQLVRRVDSPVNTAVWIRGSELWMRDSQGTKRLDVGQWGPANVLINSFLFVLRGDTANLKKHYDMTLACGGAGWRLTLTPRQADLRKILQRMEIEGTGAEPTRLSLLDGAGDLSTTRFGTANKALRPSVAQLQKFFAAVASP